MQATHHQTTKVSGQSGLGRLPHYSHLHPVLLLRLTCDAIAISQAHLFCFDDGFVFGHLRNKTDPVTEPFHLGTRVLVDVKGSLIKKDSSTFSLFTVLSLSRQPNSSI